MVEGMIKKLMDKGFGFIDIGGGDDIFFYSLVFVEVSYEEFWEG